MRSLGIASVLLAVATLYALADAALGAVAFYTLTAFLCVFLAYCWISIEHFRARLRELERATVRRDDPAAR